MILKLSRLEAVKCKASLYDFLKASWHVLNPGVKFIESEPIRAIADKLQANIDTSCKEIFALPPRQGKSNLLSVAYPCWCWLHDPSKKFIFVSYSQSLSTKFSLDRRNLINSNWYQERYRNLFQLSKDDSQKTQFTNDKRGAMFSTSIGGSLTGIGGQTIIVDDPINPQSAMSDTERENANDWIANTLFSRLDDLSKGQIYIIAQRLHSADVIGTLADKKDSEWVLNNYPAVSEDGKLSFPKRLDKDQLAKIKTEIGSLNFSAQYQQEPSLLSGNLVKRDWFKYYKHLPGEMEICISVDLSFKGGQQNDYTSMQVFGINGTAFYFLYEVHEKLDFSKQLKELKRLVSEYKPQRVLIEDSANASAIIETLKNEVVGLIPVPAVTDKTTRLVSASPTIESGRVFLPLAGDNESFINEIVKFPKAKNDDRVDALSQLINYYKDKLISDLATNEFIEEASRNPKSFMIFDRQWDDNRIPHHDYPELKLHPEIGIYADIDDSPDGANNDW